MANCPEVLITYTAAWRAGAVVTPLIFLVSEDELRHALNDSGAVGIVTTVEFLPKVSAAVKGDGPGGTGGGSPPCTEKVGGELHPVQRAFAEHDAFQCGYCTPGQLISAVACIAEGHATDDASVREWMSGNICRCSAYPQITEAVLAAAREPAADDRAGR
jgi:acyl-CoA synthetase (AMP-forming)/AMP-acid ligase II